MTATEQAPPPAPRLTGSGSRWRGLLLAAVAACAACGIVYELALLTLSASLHGGGIVAMSLIVAGYVAALGAGALLVKPLLHRAGVTFIAVETALAVIGGLSAAALYVTFAFLGGSLWVLVVGTALIGSLVGAEVPLLMTLLQRGRTSGAADTGRVLANLNAADYLGALIGGLVWPFILLPQLGMIRGAAATGISTWPPPRWWHCSCCDASSARGNSPSRWGCWLPHSGCSSPCSYAPTASRRRRASGCTRIRSSRSSVPHTRRSS